jgi:hypothetical protein
LTYVPCFHPWSIYRMDRQALQIDLLLTHARQHMEVVSCTALYDKIKTQRTLANERVPFD